MIRRSTKNVNNIHVFSTGLLGHFSLLKIVAKAARDETIAASRREMFCTRPGVGNWVLWLVYQAIFSVFDTA